MGYEHKDRIKRQLMDSSKATFQQAELQDGQQHSAAAVHVAQQKYARNVRFQALELQESEDIEQFNISFYCQNVRLQCKIQFV